MAQTAGKKLKILLLCLVLLSAFLFLSPIGSAWRDSIKDSLSERLLTVKPLPKVFYERGKSTLKSENVIYVMGGSLKTLKSRFREASDLYKKGLASKILVLHVSGITEYDRAARRNLTNDEWDTLELTGLGVRREDIGHVSVKKGLFGTLSEAKAVPRAVREMGCRRLILVTSPYHTRRVWISFSRYAKDEDGLYLYIYPSDDSTFLRWLLFEYFKLLVYENFLLK